MGFDRLRKTQAEAADELERVIRCGMLSQSILISGARGSARLTGALDLAFFLTGGDRELLKSPSVIYFASRPFLSELECARRVLLNGTKKGRLFYIQTVRKILLQYHPALSHLYKEKVKGMGAELKKHDRDDGATVASAASAADSVLLSAEDDREYSPSELESIADSISALLTENVIKCAKKTPGASIEEIRLVQDWLLDGNEAKAVIFENAEDYSEGAKNSLLKLLEEPPEGAYIILLSRNPSRLLETILSRVRKFSFPPLSAKAVQRVVSDELSFFGEYSSFDEFFFREGADESEKEIMSSCHSFYVSALLSGKMPENKDLEKMLSSLEKIDGFEYFRSLVTSSLLSQLEKGDRAKAKKAWDAFSRSMMLSDSYNMSIRLALDLALRECNV